MKRVVVALAAVLVSSVTAVAVLLGGGDEPAPSAPTVSNDNVPMLTPQEEIQRRDETQAENKRKALAALEDRVNREVSELKQRSQPPGHRPFKG